MNDRIEKIESENSDTDNLAPEDSGGCRIAILSIYDFENNAVRMLAAALRQKGHYTAEIYFKDWKNNSFDPPNQNELDNLTRILEERKISLVAVSIRASAYLKVTTQITELIRLRLGIPVLWGGTHVILCPDESIQIADMICIGEGDAALPDLACRIAEGKSIEDTPNIWIRKEEGIIKNPLSNLIQNLDQLPFRDYTSKDKFVIMGDKVSGTDPMIGDPIFQIMTSRGCPFKCSYCYNSTLRGIFEGKGKYYRTRSVDNIIEELKQAKKVFRNIRRIKFDDEVFNFQDNWVSEFHEKFKKEIGLPFECFTEPKLVEEERFRKMKESGLQIVYMGIQNSRRITNELYDRNTPDDTIRNAAEILHRLKLDTRYQVILDDPLSTNEDKEELFNLLMSFKPPFELYLFSLTVFPNTEIARKLLEQGLITEDDIEGRNTKTFKQLRVDLSYPRDPESTYWAAMLVLITKGFIPRSLLWRFYHSKKLKKNPRLLVLLAQGANMVKMGFVAVRMLLRGELTWTAVRRWLNMDSLITQ